MNTNHNKLRCLIGRLINYITHFCRNKRCNNGWVDKDLTKAKKPPTWKYCEECVAKGKKNPKKPPKDPEVEEKLKKAREAKNA